MQPRGRFPASQRVRKRAEFQRIQTAGRRVTTPHFVLLVQAREPAVGQVEARLGVTVSRKVGNAVVRNRAKRLIREAFRATRSLWPADVDLVVIAKRALAEKKLADVIDEWTAAEKAIERGIRQARNDAERRRSAPSVTK